MSWKYCEITKHDISLYVKKKKKKICTQLNVVTMRLWQQGCIITALKAPVLQDFPDCPGRNLAKTPSNEFLVNNLTNGTLDVKQSTALKRKNWSIFLVTCCAQPFWQLQFHSVFHCKSWWSNETFCSGNYCKLETSWKYFVHLHFQLKCNEIFLL